MPDLTQDDIADAIEHRDVLINLRAVLKTVSGREVFKYLFKHFRVTDFPQIGLEGPMLHDNIGMMRAGRSIWEIAAEADPETAATLLAQTEKERYAKLYSENSDGQGG